MFGMLVVVLIAFAAVIARLTLIQGVDAGRYLAVGKGEWQYTVKLAGDRGAILDRNGDELAVSIPQTTIYADPALVTDPLAESKALAPVLRVSQPTLDQELSESSQFVYLARTQPDSVASAVTKLNLPGIYTLQEPKRFNPSGQLALPLLGSVGTDGNGLAGLEAKYNGLLAGAPGKLVEQRDPQGNPVAGGLQEYTAPTRGDDLVLTIDQPLQYETEQALSQALVASHGQSGIAMLMDSQTGDLLAVAELSTPSAAQPQTMMEPPAVPLTVPGSPSVLGSVSGGQPVESPRASAFTEVYEPGSVNKLITISAALQQRAVVPTDNFVIPDSYPVAGTVFHDAESHPVENFSVTDILANSSNIGTIQIAQRLGKTQLLKYLSAYGMGSRTDIAFPGESAGLMPTYWSGTSLATVAFGQGIGVTAMQMLAAYNTIANGGVYLPPKLVKGTIDSKGAFHPTRYPAPHRVVSTTVANQMTSMLDQVVNVGTGTAANLNPYTVAGKTGTASVPTAGGYEAGHYVASFAGFVPAEKPSITAMVQIYNTPDFGASASAPAFGVIARDALDEFQIPPQPKQPLAPGVPPPSTSAADPFGQTTSNSLPTPTMTAVPPPPPPATGPSPPSSPATAPTTTVPAPHPRT
jgi:cell division protein FtsI (penicillin-binding protein 3)